MKCNAVARQRRQTVSAQAHVRHADVKQPQAAGRSQNRMHVQKALMEYRLLGRIARNAMLWRASASNLFRRRLMSAQRT